MGTNDYDHGRDDFEDLRDLGLLERAIQTPRRAIRTPRRAIRTPRRPTIKMQALDGRWL